MTLEDEIPRHRARRVATQRLDAAGALHLEALAAGRPLVGDVQSRVRGGARARGREARTIVGLHGGSLGRVPPLGRAPARRREGPGPADAARRARRQAGGVVSAAVSLSPAFVTQHGDCRFRIRPSLRAVSAPDVGVAPRSRPELTAKQYAACERAVRCACKGRVLGRDKADTMSDLTQTLAIGVLGTRARAPRPRRVAVRRRRSHGLRPLAQRSDTLRPARRVEAQPALPPHRGELAADVVPTPP